MLQFKNKTFCASSELANYSLPVTIKTLLTIRDIGWLEITHIESLAQLISHVIDFTRLRLHDAFTIMF